MDTTSPQLDHSAIGDLQRGVLADLARPTTSALAGRGPARAVCPARRRTSGHLGAARHPRRRKQEGQWICVTSVRLLLQTGRGLTPAARMTAEVRQAATEAGLWLLVAPHEVGGGEVSLPELVSIFEQLGWADPAFCWIAMNSTMTEVMGASPRVGCR